MADPNWLDAELLFPQQDTQPTSELPDSEPVSLQDPNEGDVILIEDMPTVEEEPEPEPQEEPQPTESYVTSASIPLEPALSPTLNRYRLIMR